MKQHRSEIVTISNISKNLVDHYGDDNKKVGIRFVYPESATGWAKLFIPEIVSQKTVAANMRLVTICASEQQTATLRVPTDKKGHFRLEKMPMRDAKAIYEKSREIARGYKKAMQKHAEREVPEVPGNDGSDSLGLEWPLFEI